jgi:hypothetical protein
METRGDALGVCRERSRQLEAGRGKKLRRYPGMRRFRPCK